MSVETPPIFIQTGGETAERARRALHAYAGIRGGIVQAGDLAVTENGTPNMSVNVATGQVIIPGTEGTYQGVYVIENRGTLNVAIAAADGTNPRKDLIVAKVQDAAYSGASNVASIVAVTGTPAGSPAEPAVPANAWVLAMVDVPALDTAITNSQITDRRTQQTSPTQKGQASALGGVITCTTGNRPAHVEGRVIYETDTDRLLLSDGTNWVRATSLTLAAQTGCRLRRAANQSVNSAATTSISWDTEDKDTDGFIAVTATTVTIPAGLSGLYAITFVAECPTITGTSALLAIVPTSAITFPTDFMNFIDPAVNKRGTVSATIPLNAGDTFLCQVRHNTGSAQNFTAWLNCIRLGA